MNHSIKSIRPFIGALDYNVSRSFYRDLGFEETVLFDNMCLFAMGDFGFYLQKAYVKDWVDNSMIFLEVDNVDQYYNHLHALALPDKYPGVRLSAVQSQDWGRVCYLHDPAGILWHIGQFS
jgi:catechol 2,3-dioxygenase-like lactoylglutathione lyase family enzyme